MVEELEQAVKELQELTTGMQVGWERPFPARVYVDVDRAGVRELARVLLQDSGARFATASGCDVGDRLEAVYHFCQDATGLVVSLRVSTPKAEARLPSLTPLAPAVEWIEREMHDLLGITFEGHPRPERLILADDWPEGVYPLRKDTSHEA
jgi:Ni,Fe-hydrogenase III component G